MGKQTLVAVFGVLAIAGAFVFGDGGSAGVRSTALRAPAAESPAEGITVHGHWRLDIFDADGSFDRSVEFENALLPSGGETLARILGRDLTPGGWTVRLQGSPQPCLNSSSAAVDCWIREEIGTSTEPFNFDGLTLDLSTPGELTLSGSATIATTTEITSVRTEVDPCASSVAPADVAGCPHGAVSGFTQKTTAEPGFTAVPVEAGQIVTAVVTLSFS